MPPNETTVLLTNYREKHIIHSLPSGYGANEPLVTNGNSHVVNVGKAPDEYEPIFSIEDDFSALTLAELLPFQDDPWWQKLRRIFFMSFWLIFLMALATACLLAYLKADQLLCNEMHTNLMSSTTTGNTLPITDILKTQLSDSTISTLSIVAAI